MIGNDEILTMLRSSNPDTVLDALFAMTGDKALTLSVSTLDVAQSCFRHGDPDIRRQAVIAVGIQIGYSPAFPALVELLKTEDDEDVADAMISAIASLAKGRDSLLPTAFRALQETFIGSQRSKRLRAVSYIEARWLFGEIEPRERAASLLAPERVQLDQGWFDSHSKFGEGCG